MNIQEMRVLWLSESLMTPWHP